MFKKGVSVFEWASHREEHCVCVSGSLSVYVFMFVSDTAANVSLFLVISHSRISPCSQRTYHTECHFLTPKYIANKALYAPASIKPKGVKLNISDDHKYTRNYS